MEGLVVGAVLVPVVLAAVVMAVRQLGAIQMELVQRTTEAMWGPRAVEQPVQALEQPAAPEPMYPPWEETPWSMEERPGPQPSEGLPS